MVRRKCFACLSASGQVLESDLEGSSAVFNELMNIETSHIVPWAHCFTFRVLVPYLVAALGVDALVIGTEPTLTVPQRISNPSDGSLKLRNVKSIDDLI